MGRQISILLLAGAMVLTGCGSATVPSRAAASADPVASATATRTPIRSAADDLGLLLRTLEGTHPDPFHGIPRDEFTDALDDLAARLPDLGPHEAAVELMRLWALLSRDGRDGHQFALPAATADDPMLPIRLYEFEDGVFITDALGAADLAGSRIVAIGGHSIGEVLAAVEPLVPRDGPQTVTAHRPILLLRTTVLRGLGIAGEGPVTLGVIGPDGVERDVALEPVDARAYGDWAGPFGTFQLPPSDEARYLAGDQAFTADRIDGDAALYLRYRFVSPPATDLASDALADGPVDRLILDLRQNPGGDNNTYDRLLRFVQDWARDHPGRTFVLTDRVTFSAAANLATRIEATTDAVFVGEPMGGAPNLWADVTWVTLRDFPIPMRVAISTVYWQMAEPDDPRLTITPDIPTSVTAADHFAGRDAALDAALVAPAGFPAGG